MLQECHRVKQQAEQAEHPMAVPAVLVLSDRAVAVAAVILVLVIQVTHLLLAELERAQLFRSLLLNLVAHKASRFL